MQTPTTFRAEALLIGLLMAHAALGIGLYFGFPALYHAYVREDGYIEYATAGLLLTTAAWCAYRATQLSAARPRVLFALLAVVFGLGCGEEISWGQRLLGFDTPADLQQLNAQGEFNFHNLKLGGVSVNKLVFGKILYTGIVLYFLGLPLLSRRRRGLARLAATYQVPVPTLRQGLLYCATLVAVLFIPHGRKWELEEFAIAGFLFVAFRWPATAPAAVAARRRRRSVPQRVPRPAPLLKETA